MTYKAPTDCLYLYKRGTFPTDIHNHWGSLGWLRTCRPGYHLQPFTCLEVTAFGSKMFTVISIHKKCLYVCVQYFWSITFRLALLRNDMFLLGGWPMLMNDSHKMREEEYGEPWMLWSLVTNKWLQIFACVGTWNACHKQPHLILHFFCGIWRRE